MGNKKIIEAIDLLFMTKKIDNKEDLAQKLTVNVDYIDGILNNIEYANFDFIKNLINTFNLNANFFFKDDCNKLFDYEVVKSDDLSKMQYALEVLNMKYHFALRRVELCEQELELNTLLIDSLKVHKINSNGLEKPTNKFSIMQ